MTQSELERDLEARGVIGKYSNTFYDCYCEGVVMPKTLTASPDIKEVRVKELDLQPVPTPLPSSPVRSSTRSTSTTTTVPKADIPKRTEFGDRADDPNYRTFETLLPKPVPINRPTPKPTPIDPSAVNLDELDIVDIVDGAVVTSDGTVLPAPTGNPSSSNSAQNPAPAPRTPTINTGSSTTTTGSRSSSSSGSSSAGGSSRSTSSSGGQGGNTPTTTAQPTGQTPGTQTPTTSTPVANSFGISKAGGWLLGLVALGLIAGRIKKSKRPVKAKI